MKKLRILLLPVAVPAELIALAVCWAFVPFHRPTATRMTNWATQVFPDMSWFLGA